MPRRFPIPNYPAPLPLQHLRVFPLEIRKSLTTVDQILVPLNAHPAPTNDFQRRIIDDAVQAIIAARERNAAVMLIYGAHLLRNGAALLLDEMMANGWITHLATNGAGTIHDWEYAWLGRSTESVEENVTTGTFGAWDETARIIHLALYAGSIRAEGYGRALGRFIAEDGTVFPTYEELGNLIVSVPDDPLNPARFELLLQLKTNIIRAGRRHLEHRWKHASILASAFRHNIPLTVHPGIGYDIISNHPIFNGALIGRTAQTDFQIFGGSVERLDHGVVLSVGSAIMGPQIFEKSLSCVNNIRLQQKRPIISGHSIYVVDLQDGGNWDWTTGEPPKTNPAYYLRFCKSFSRMGGRMQYLQCDNLSFIQNLYHALAAIK
jgi:hypothetical protein